MASDKTTTTRTVPFAETYQQLAAPFETTFKDVRGGVELEYITGEQAVTRLNETLGVAGWSFRVLEHGYHQEADEVWVLGELTAQFGPQTVVRQQFGSQKLHRSRASGAPLDLGFDLKGAATDALKKCASLVGVGLYLFKKEAPAALGNGNGSASHPAEGLAAAVEASGVPSAIGVALGCPSGPIACEECGVELKETRFKDGTAWSPLQLAGYGRRKHGRVLCMDHYRQANEARRRAVVGGEEAPF